MTKLFLIHSDRDRDFVDRLTRDLRDLGAGIRIDASHLNAGDSLLGKIRYGLDVSEYVGVVVSHASMSLSSVRRELDAATIRDVPGEKMKVFCIFIDEVAVPACLYEKSSADFGSSFLYHLTLSGFAAGMLLSSDESPEVSDSGDRASRCETMDDRVLWGQRFNRAGMMLMEWSGVYPERAGRDLYSEAWRRCDDAATYAVDTGNYELYKQSIEKLEKIEATDGGWMRRFSHRNLVMQAAAKLFRRAAACGDPEGYWNLGWRFKLGQGVEINTELSLFCWSCAADTGHAAATDELRGRGIDATEVIESGRGLRDRVLKGGLG